MLNRFLCLAVCALCAVMLLIAAPVMAAESGITNAPLADKLQKWYDRLDLGMDAAAIIQFNSTGESARTPISGRVRVKADFSIDEGFDMIFRVYASGGRSMLHGESSAFAPINDIAMREVQSEEDANRPPVIADMAYVRYERGPYTVTGGLIDLDSFEKDGDGFLTNPVTMDEMHAFSSGHFTRDLAANFMESDNYSSLAALTGTWRISDPLTLRAAVTFGDSGNHFFVRNTAMVELAYKYSLLGYDDNKLDFALGFSDADESETHKMSPSGVIGLGQRVSEHFRVFAGFSRGEEWKRVATLFGSVLWHANAGITYSSNDAGPKEARHYAGLGVSVLRAYGEHTTEKAIEVFWRYRALKHAFITPDLQVLYNPGGETGRTDEWAIIPGLKATVFF